jgi:tetratricopeptide (TPR) repeat protein
VLGGLYRREGRYDEAIEQYTRAAAVDPTSSHAMSGAASLYWYRGQAERAIYYFERIEALTQERIGTGRDVEFWLYYDQAIARLAQGKRAAARDDLARALSIVSDIENFRSMLFNLRFLHSADQPMEGLDEFITMVEQRMQQVAPTAARVAPSADE